MKFGFQVDIRNGEFISGIEMLSSHATFNMAAKKAGKLNVCRFWGYICDFHILVTT